MVKLGSHQSYRVSASSACHLQNVTSTPDLQNSVIVVTLFYFIKSLGYWIKLKAWQKPGKRFASTNCCFPFVKAEDHIFRRLRKTSFSP